MLNSIRENRIQRDGLYEVTLQIPEDDFFFVYDSITVDAAREILDKYLAYHQDDGRPGEINIRHNKNGHVVDITVDMHYTGNDHTDAKPIPDALNITRRNEWGK